MILAVKLLGPSAEGGTGDAEFGSQLINILWVSVFFCQFIQAHVRLTVPMRPDLLPNDLDCHIKGTEAVSTKSIASLKGKVWTLLALCSYYYLHDVDIGFFAGRVLLTTLVMTCLLSEESELGWQTGGHCGKGGTALTLLPPLYFLRKKKETAQISIRMNFSWTMHLTHRKQRHQRGLFELKLSVLPYWWNMMV